MQTPKLKLKDWVAKNQNKIDWQCLSQNPAAVHLLQANPEKLDWPMLSQNPAAIHLLEANPDKIYWNSIWANPAIFELDYKKNARML